MLTAAVALIPILGALIPMAMRRSSHTACASAAAGVTLFALTLLLSHAPAVFSGERVETSVAWVPQLNLSFSFAVDGLGLFFAGLILVMGLLVILYARFYLDSSDPISRFYAILLVFQGAMLGIVLSNNVLLMIVFWELTSLSSFLLIGYWSYRPESRQGARMALVVTGGGGLALIAGMLLLGNIAGSYEIGEILQRGEQVRASPLAPAALGLILIGAFTKSAQFPFHSWLPNAMAAPTPVSAYLHSATMVKAGIFLLARLWPVFAPMDMWVLIVSLVGLITMLIGAATAVFKDDLKQLLAYSTVSHLGLIVMLLGIGTPEAAFAAMLHLLNHALFKAALFMSAGIVDHEAGTRDMRQVSGLGKLMPVTAGLAIVAAASMAGLPFLNGFISKEMMLEQVAGMRYAGLPLLFPALATFAALLSVAYSFRMVQGTFMGTPRYPDDDHPPHDPPMGMWLPVAILVGPVVLIGILPFLIEPFVKIIATSVVGRELPNIHLALWHGLTPALAMSVIAVIGGVVVMMARSSLDTRRLPYVWPDGKRVFEAAVENLVDNSWRLLLRIDTSNLQRYMAIAVAAIIAVGAFAFLGGTHAAGTRPTLQMSPAAFVVWVSLIAASAVAVMREHDRLLLILMTSVVGFISCLAFIQFSAPDLALTQISIEVVTTILMLLALNLMPKMAPRETSPAVRWRDGAISVVAGLGLTGLAYTILTRGFDTISGYHLAQSVPGGGGSNVVNVILVDFRGFDTLGEIMVLGIAGLAIYAMLDSALTGRAGQRLSKVQTGPRPGEPHSLILSVSTRILLPLAVMAGVYIFLRGHNQPGGGFIAGIVIGIAFIMQYIASGYVWSNQRVRFDPQALIGWGILLAASTGMAAWLFGYPFLTSTHGHFHVPLIGHIELASVILFDLGVFSTVVGILLISLANLSRVEQPDGGDGAGEEFIEPAADAPPSGIPPSAAVALKAQREGI